MNPKYCLHPGWVISINDGDRHWIDAENLRACYNLPREECISLWEYHPDRDGKLVDLFPRNSGDYAQYLSSIKEQP